MSTPSRESITLRETRAAAMDRFARAAAEFVRESEQAIKDMPPHDAESDFYIGAMSVLSRVVGEVTVEYRETADLWERVAAAERGSRAAAAHLEAVDLAERRSHLTFVGELTTWAEGAYPEGSVLHVEDCVAVRVAPGMEFVGGDCAAAMSRMDRPGWSVYRYEEVPDP